MGLVRMGWRFEGVRTEKWELEGAVRTENWMLEAWKPGRWLKQRNMEVGRCS